MTLAAYQDAFARMVLSPSLCVRARAEGESAFAGVRHDAAERARLLHIARQPGMRITCILARANRLSSLAGALPRQCELLKPELGRFLTATGSPADGDLQSLPAGLAFAQYLADEIEPAVSSLGSPSTCCATSAPGWNCSSRPTPAVRNPATTQPCVNWRSISIRHRYSRRWRGRAGATMLPDTPTTLVLDFRKRTRRRPTCGTRPGSAPRSRRAVDAAGRTRSWLSRPRLDWRSAASISASAIQRRCVRPRGRAGPRCPSGSCTARCRRRPTARGAGGRARPPATAARAARSHVRGCARDGRAGKAPPPAGRRVPAPTAPASAARPRAAAARTP